ncbi:MAG: hypothetical protein IJC50_04855 [Clostridia bacterium]|nr:hypothetical protein [Clostridia bacterium]
MIKILSTYDLLKIEDTVLREHVEGIVNDIMNYNAVDSLESVGAIFVLESADEPLNPSLFGLSLPLKEPRFEWIDTFHYGKYMDGVIVIDNSKSISIIGKAEYFKHILEE